MVPTHLDAKEKIMCGDIDAAWAAGVAGVLAEALGGRGRVVLLLREAGMGKSMR
jgi:hypothetical protein